MSFTAEDHRHMARALELARRGLYTTEPNPRVGCVLVREGRVVGEGWHARAGEAHAEVRALAAAGAAARGATAYVTLEPCCHHGRTPPCTGALLEAGVARVVAAMQDPNPRVAGQGLRVLREAGVEVASGLMAAEARALNVGFCARMERGRPWVRAKLAMSLDGRTAMASGESQWITGPAARADVQRWRARSSAILTGRGTVLADDPALTVRDAALQRLGQPLRVVVDSALRTPPGARLLREPGSTLIATCSQDECARKVLEAAGAEVLVLPAASEAEQVDLRALLDALAAREINEVLVEAGATLNGALLSAGLVDELMVYLAPVLLGDSARGLFHLPGLARMSERTRLALLEVRTVGEDLRLTLRPRGSE